MITKDQQYLLNHANVTAQKVGLGDEIMKTKNIMKCQYDFAVQGGAIGTISYYTDLKALTLAQLPAKAVVVNAWFDVLTAPTSGGSATVAAQSEAANDLLAATAIASITGQLQGVPNNVVANYKKTTVARTIKSVIATAALTAGKWNLFVEYVISD